MQVGADERHNKTVASLDALTGMLGKFLKYKMDGKKKNVLATAATQSQRSRRTGVEEPRRQSLQD